VDRLTNDVLVAQSRAWWSDPQTLSQGEAYASDARGEAAAALAKITIGGISQITMTSRSGKVPVVLFNNTGFPVRVTLHLFSPSLGLNQSLPERLATATQPITVPVTAKASGIFPLQISLETPDGSIAIGRRTIQLRSTNFNQVAVGITIGALIFLVLFYLQRGLRRRRQRHQQPEATTA
jgi:hypothetical protein